MYVHSPDMSNGQNQEMLEEPSLFHLASVETGSNK